MQRDYSLDALRGLAIIGMVLSGMIQHNPELPSWMFHAQVGPRSGFGFDASVIGITWVDLIFPMFLFAMGGAMSFSIGGAIRRGQSLGAMVCKLLVRMLKLILFALAVRQLHPYVLNGGLWGWGYALLAFCLFAAAFARFPRLAEAGWAALIVSWSGVVGLIAMLLCRGWLFGKPFTLASADIIILVLANVSFVGGLLYWVTYRKPVARLMTIGVVAAMFLVVSEHGSWNAQVWGFSLWKLLPNSLSEHAVVQNLGISGAPLFVNISFWKYLIVVLLGSVAGDCVVRMNRLTPKENCRVELRILLLAAAIVICNTTLLYMRELWLNLVVNALLCLLLYTQTRKCGAPQASLIRFAIVVIAFGLIFEAHQGGIRKDFTTIGYLVLTAGLSALIMLFFGMLTRLGVNYTYIYKIGQNPLVGYVAGGYVVLPLLALIGLLPLLDGLHTDYNAWFAFVRGCVVTLGMAALTIWMVNWKLFFRI